MELNSLSFCFSVKLLISPLYLNKILAGYSNLGCRLFSFITLSMSCHSLLVWRLSIERSALILMGIPLCVICCFSLAAFNISSQLLGYSPWNCKESAMTKGPTLSLFISKPHRKCTPQNYSRNTHIKEKQSEHNSKLVIKSQNKRIKEEGKKKT